jgi:hypothetical protein
VVGGWRNLHKEELRNFYSSPDIISVIESRKDQVGGSCSMYGRDEKCVQNFSRKT